MSNNSIKVFVILWVMNIINLIVVPYMEENTFWMYIFLQAIFGFYLGVSMRDSDDLKKMQDNHKEIEKLLLFSTLLSKKEDKKESGNEETQETDLFPEKEA